MTIWILNFILSPYYGRNLETSWHRWRLLKCVSYVRLIHIVRGRFSYRADHETPAAYMHGNVQEILDVLTWHTEGADGRIRTLASAWEDALMIFDITETFAALHLATESWYTWYVRDKSTCEFQETPIVENSANFANYSAFRNRSLGTGVFT